MGLGIRRGFESIRARLLSQPEAGRHSARLAYFIDQAWRDPHGIYVKGWVHCYGQTINNVAVQVGDNRVFVENFHDRPDLLSHYPELGNETKCGFETYLPCGFDPPGLVVTIAG